jgi:hypothetical protein
LLHEGGMHVGVRGEGQGACCIPEGGSCIKTAPQCILSDILRFTTPTPPQELFEPLQLMYNSLMMTGDESTANHRLLDMLRQVTTFGLSLMKLDIRQESTRHTEVRWGGGRGEGGMQQWVCVSPHDTQMCVCVLGGGS